MAWVKENAKAMRKKKVNPLKKNFALPPRSPDMMPLDISLFGILKNKIFDDTSNPLRTRGAFKAKLLKIMRGVEMKKTCKQPSLENYT
jgi:hypothetical protein